MSAATKRFRWLSRRSRWVRALAAVALALLSLLLVVALLISLPPVRGQLLDSLLVRATADMPGRITFGAVAWDHLGSVRLDDLLWVVDGDTLLAADRVELAVDLEGLRARDLIVERFAVLGLRADAPALAAAFPSPSAAPADSGGATAAVPFLREGAWVPWPSAAVLDLEVTAREIRLDGGRRLRDIALRGQGDLRAGRPARARLDSLRARVAPEGWTLFGRGIEYRPADPTLALFLDALRDDGLSVTLDMKPDHDATLHVAGGEAAPGLDLQGLLGWSPADPLRLALEAHGALPGDRTLQRLRVEAASDSGLAGPFTAQVRVAAFDLDLAARARVEIGDSLVVALSPLDLALDDGPLHRDHDPGALAGRLVVHPGDGIVVSARDLALSGALGALRLDGRLDGTGVVGRLRGEWPEPPAYLRHLARGRAGDDAAARAAQRIGELWPAGETVGAEIDLDLERSRGPGGPLDSGRASASLRLPGPRSFQPLLPEGLAVDDLGLVRARIDADFRPDRDGGAAIAGRLDLSETDWIETGLLDLRHAGGRTRVDTLNLSLPGLELAASGVVDTADLDLRARIRLPDASLPARLPSAFALPVDLAVDLDLHAVGPVRGPVVRAELVAGVRSEDLNVPSLTATATVSPDTLAVKIDLPEGIVAGPLALDGASLAAASAGPEAARQDLAFLLNASGPDLGLRAGGRLGLEPDPTAAVDSLFLRLARADLVSAGPFRIGRVGDRAWGVDDLDLAGTLGHVAASGTATPDSLSVDARTELRLPSGFLRRYLSGVPLPENPDLEVTVRGQARLRGSGLVPRATATASVMLHGSERLAPLALAADAELSPERGLTASARLTQADTMIVQADGRLPLSVTLTPFAASVGDADSLRATLATAWLNLQDFRRFLPPTLATRGRLRAEGSLAGDGDAFAIAGTLDVPELRVDVDDGSWAQAGGSLTVEGTTRAPVVRGRIDLQGGVIHLPELPPTLLPVRGEALLRPEGFSSPAAVAGAPAAADSGRTAPPSVDLRVVLSSPGNFWLRGRGLDVEMAGDLRLAWSGAVPVVVGDLEAQQGTLKFLGRIFTIERGRVTFVGDPESDPALDLKLTTRLQGVTYAVELSGPAARPTLALTSSPEMGEGDIVSNLLFGKPLNDLDGGQQNLLRDRATQIAAAYGAARLQQQLGGALGVDMIAYNQASEQDRGDSLLIGKYLSPRVLLKYEQRLDRANAFFVTLDYTLSRTFQLETTVGQGPEAASGAELKWGRDY